MREQGTGHQPATPDGWAAKITRVLNEIHKLQGTPHYPLCAKDIAYEFSRQYFPNSSIRNITGAPLEIDGALFPVDGSQDWVLLYSSTVSSMGRINFTIAHEFGHFLLHRLTFPNGFRCSQEIIENWGLKNNIEKEANQFSASLLMPYDDFRREVGNSVVSLDLFHYLANRYRVSMTAIMLRWIHACAKRASVVYSVDGYVDWIYSSPDLIKSGVYKNPKKDILPVPEESLALMTSGRSFHSHPKDVWSEDEAVDELVFCYRREGLDIGVSLLLYPDEPPELAEERYGLYTSPQCRIFEES